MKTPIKPRSVKPGERYPCPSCGAPSLGKQGHVRGCRLASKPQASYLCATDDCPQRITQGQYCTDCEEDERHAYQLARLP